MEPKPRILLVDDDAAITSKLAPFLARAGFTVEVAGDGEAALHRAANFAPNLIILDVLMPKLDGREVCRRLRAAGNWTPIIMLTQVGEATERAMALEEGADDYLNKPFDPLELVARMRAVLRRARPGVPPLAATQRLACAPFVLDRAARDADYLWNANSFVREIERYDPVANAWRTVGALPLPRAAAAAALLPDGRLWLTGGRTATASLSDTWLIGARVGSPSATCPQWVTAHP